MKKFTFILITWKILLFAHIYSYYAQHNLKNLYPISHASTFARNLPHIRYFLTDTYHVIGIGQQLTFHPKSRECTRTLLKKFHFAHTTTLPNGDIVATVKSPLQAIEISKQIYESNCALFSHPDFLLQASKRSIYEPLFFPQQWNLKNYGQYGGVPGADIDALGAWKYSKGKGIKIAVIDDGFDIYHPDLQGQFIEGIDLLNHDTDVLYDNSYEMHGTLCTGIIAAKENGKGLIGIAPQAKIIPIKLLGNYLDGSPKEIYTSDIVRAFIYANEAGADVINCSWGTYEVADNVRNIINYLAVHGRGGKGLPIVFATGNDGESQAYWKNDESALPSVIAVGASTNKNRLAWYSNYGPALDFVAPGGDHTGITGTLSIATTDITGRFGLSDYTYGHPDYTYATDPTGFDGTSAVAPMVSATIALMLARDKELTRDEIVDILRQTTDKIGDYPYVNGRNDYFGYGKINAKKAVEETIRRKVIKQVRRKTFSIDGYFIHYDKGPFEWLYVRSDFSFVAKLEGMNLQTGALRWDIFHTSSNPAFSDIYYLDGDRLYFGAALKENHSLVSFFANKMFNVNGYFIHYDRGRYDWIYITRDLSCIAKLDGMDEQGYFIWVKILNLHASKENNMITFQ